MVERKSAWKNIFSGLLFLILMLGLVYYALSFRHPYPYLCFGVLGIAIVTSIITYWYFNDWYWINIGKIRRIYYGAFVLLVLVGYINGSFTFDNWSIPVQLAVLAIFIDIAVLQGHNITKIFNTELQQENEILKTIAENHKAIISLTNRVGKCSAVIQQTRLLLNSVHIQTDWERYKQVLEQYLKHYTGVYGHIIGLFRFEFDDEPEKLQTNIRHALKDALTLHTVQTPKNFLKEASQRVIDGEIVIVEEKKLCLVGYYGLFHNFIISIEAKDSPVDTIDAMHLLNLAIIFDWWISEDHNEQDEMVTQNVL